MIISSVVGHIKEALEGDHGNKTKIKGTVILMKKNALDLTDFNASILDRVHEFLGRGVTFQLVSSTIPGAVVVKNSHAAEFFLKSLTIEDFAGRGRIFFDCNSWVYPTRCYKYDRVFFSNDIAGTFRERRYLVTSYGCILTTWMGFGVLRLTKYATSCQSFLGLHCCGMSIWSCPSKLPLII